MSLLTRSTATPLYISRPTYQNEQIRMINSNETIINEPLVRYETPRIVRRTYRTPPKPRYQYMVEQVHFIIICFFY